MKILFICGFVGKEHYKFISTKSIGAIENSANEFQRKIINGLKNQSDVNLDILSAPLVGAWPSAYKEIYFPKLIDENKQINYVDFNNIYGFRNISRTFSLKKNVKKFMIETRGQDRAIIVYCAHTPFIEAAVYARKFDRNIKIHLIVPDLPQYMNLNKKKPLFYKFLKRIDNGIMLKLIKNIDTFTLLTDQMAKVLNIGERKYNVIEGIIPDDVCIEKINKNNDMKSILYSGKLIESFGIKKLIDAFLLLKSNSCRLMICGSGELEDYVKRSARLHENINYFGQVAPKIVRELQRKADVLVNPRCNDSEYTKYSFPSKNLEYLMTGNPVVAYMLDGIPEKYIDYFYVPKDNSEVSLANALRKALKENVAERNSRIEKMQEDIFKKLSSFYVARSIIDIIKNI